MKRGYYLTMHLRRPCTPESLALANFLLQEEQPPGKVQQLLAADAAFIKQRRFAVRIIHGALYAARLIRLAFIAKNHSPLDLACARLLKRTALQKARGKLRLGRFKTLRRLRDVLRARKLR